MSMSGSAMLVFGFPLNDTDPPQEESFDKDENGCSIKASGVFDTDTLYVAAICRELDMYDGSEELDLRALVDQESEATKRLRKFCSVMNIEWREPKWYQLLLIRT